MLLAALFVGLLYLIERAKEHGETRGRLPVSLYLFMGVSALAIFGGIFVPEAMRVFTYFATSFIFMLVLAGWRPAFDFLAIHLKFSLRCADNQCAGAGLGRLYRHQHQEKGNEDFLAKHITLRIMVKRYNLVKALGSPELNWIYKNCHLISPPC